MTAQQADPRPSWPPSDASVAFHEEMFALLTMGASVKVAAREVAREETPRGMSRQEWRRARLEERARLRDERMQAREDRALARENVDVQVRDRYGNSLRVRRVEREPGDERPRAYAPRPFGPFGDR